MSFMKPVWVLLAAAIAPISAFAAESQISGSTRWATFQDAEREFYALSIHADPRGEYPLASAFEVVILFDTSATQTGLVRREALEALEELVLSLAPATKVSLLACDVETVDLSQGLVLPTDSNWETAVARLKKRIPLGTTDLGTALKTAAKQFSQGEAQKSIVYIGDGVNRRNFLNSDQQGQMVQGLVDRQITFTSFAIGPFTDVATLAALSNHTGGILLSRAEIRESAQSIGRFLGQSTSAPVIWVADAGMPSAFRGHFPKQFPPLRIDRDTVIVGQVADQSQAGRLVLKGTCAGHSVVVQADASPEASNPDMGFLTAVVERAAVDGGLSLPALGSDGLRAMSFALADSATAMVKSGQFALKSGQIDSAIRIAEEALKSDPNNAAAISLLNAAREEAGEDVPTGKFMQAPLAGDQPGDLLAEVDALRAASAQALKVDVTNQINSAYKLANRDPTAVKNSLKLLLEELDNATDVDAALRAQLRDQVRSALRDTSIKEARYLEQVQQAEAIRTQADQVQRLLAETGRREESLKMLVEQFNYLMSQKQFLAASKDVAPEIGKLAPDTPLDYVSREKSSITSNQKLLLEAFEAREQGFVDSMRGVEEAAVPFDGIPPLVYPPADVWQALSARRLERYGAINLAGSSDVEQKIYSALKQDREFHEIGTPLQTVMSTLSSELGINIQLNRTELEAIAVDPDVAVDLDLPAPISVRSALRIMLAPHDLTYIIRNEVLEITSTDAANDDAINKIYPVSDLVIQTFPGGGGMGGMMGGMGGMGGGMGGMGGMGGGMGGMGGMGGGMGGMGGMGGGMMGGMGGGMFAVPDDSSKSNANARLKMHHSSSVIDVAAWVAKFESANDEERVVLDEKVHRLVQSTIEVASAHLEVDNQAGAQGEFEKIIELVGGLLGAGFPQPWMYQALSLSMEACDYPDKDIERVLLSSLDFAGDSSQAFHLASYMARRGMKGEALSLLHDIAVTEPYRYDVFTLALPLASELGELDALRWTCLGILSKAWTKQQASLYRQAERVAKATQLKLARDGRVVEAKVFGEEIKAATVRDLAVRVIWSGNADLDIRVREPAGTICTVANPYSVAGGVLLSDASSSSEKPSLEGYSEYYVCSEGYSGQYDIMVRKVWGEVAGGKATVEIYTDYGTPEQSCIVQQFDVADHDTVFQVAVKNGHRQQPIAEAQLANVQKKQMKTASAVLGQFGGSSSSAADDFANIRQALAARTLGLGFPVGGGVIGYMPQITNLQEGANLSVSGAISADRRYVKFAPTPFFNGIGEVLTFNFVSGQQGQNGQGGGGFGGAGIGGGLGGGGQGGIGF
ncbi:MAG: hypothetical protein KDB22_09410 [Planctomycetales bacterium]|nr:hypothetical protein [Planctomycetales bacterium]